MTNPWEGILIDNADADGVQVENLYAVTRLVGGREAQVATLSGPAIYETREEAAKLAGFIADHANVELRIVRFVRAELVETVEP